MSPKPKSSIQIGEHYGCFEVISLEFRPSGRRASTPSSKRHKNAWWCVIRCECGREYKRHVRSVKDYPQAESCKCSYTVGKNGQIRKRYSVIARHVTLLEALITYSTASLKSRIEFKNIKGKGGFVSVLTKEEVEALILAPCTYCGHPGSNTFKYLDYPPLFYNGIDRVNNDLGYITENVVTCCIFCNRAKGAGSLEEFLTWRKRIQNFTPTLNLFQGELDLKYRAAYTGIWHLKKNSAKFKNRIHDLTKDQFLSLALANCYYCGVLPSNSYTLRGITLNYSGIDRKDSAVGYIFTNCLPCCFRCNRAKNKYSYEDFLNYTNLSSVYEA